MIGYVTLGTNDLKRAIGFYDTVLAKLGALRFMDEPDHFMAWKHPDSTCGLSITRPFDGKPATVGNGTMVALQATSRQQVDEVHAEALALGARDEGAPGERMPGFYAGYFRDLDGNKLNVFCAGGREG